MSTSHLSEYELRQRIDEREAALADALHLLVMQCRVVAIDQDALIGHANAVTSAAMALRQCKETLAYMEANTEWHVKYGKDNEKSKALERVAPLLVSMQAKKEREATT